MSVSLSDSLLDLNCSATPNNRPVPVADRADVVIADDNNRISEGGAVLLGAGGNAINEGASGSSHGNNRNGSNVAGPSRMYVPVYMEVDEDYREFCEQFGFEVSGKLFTHCDYYILIILKYLTEHASLLGVQRLLCAQFRRTGLWYLPFVSVQRAAVRGHQGSGDDGVGRRGFGQR